MRRRSNSGDFEFSGKTIRNLVIGFLGMITILFVGCSSMYEVDAEETVVVQTPGGKLEVRDTPGYKFDLMAKVTRYYKTQKYEFDVTKDENGKVVSTSNCLATRFNDQGKGTLCGSFTFNLPSDHEQILELHRRFHSMEGIVRKLIKPAAEKSAYNTGPLMSSKESSTTKRGDILQYFREQAKIGVYQTNQEDVEVPDLLAPPVKTVKTFQVPKKDKDGKPVVDENGQPVMVTEAHEVEEHATKTVTRVSPKLDSKGQILVQERSTVSMFGLELYDFTISKIFYEEKVKRQIDTQRDMEMAVQTKIAEAKKAQQDVITAEEQGKAAAAKAKWEQERIKAEQVTKAEAKREVAELDLQAAELERQATIERAKGEAEAKEMVMKADGALAQKLETWLKAQEVYAAAIAKHKQVPDIVMGGEGGSGADMTSQMLQMMGIAQARQLQLDMGVKK